MNTIRKIFELINRILDGSLNLTDEAVSWTDEIVIESQLARKAISIDRAKRVQELEVKASELPALEK